MTEAGGGALEIPGYRDVTVVGRGASSTVFRAHDVELSRPVAIKVLLADDPDDPARRRFKREGVITANLGRHPHIVQVLGTGFTDDGHPYVVMELFEQGSIADRLRTAGTFSVPETLDIGAKVADAVSAAHRAGVLHRDIKPQNVLLSEYGPALGDFGIARTTTNLEWSQSLDQLTPMHAAPEILSGGTSTVQSDVYSLGSTLYTMLSGRPPFAGPSGESPLRYQLRVLQEPVPPIPRADVGEAVMAVLERALAKSPGDRFASAAELHDALEAPLRALGATADEGGGTAGPTGRPVGGGGVEAVATGGGQVAPAVGSEDDELTVHRRGSVAGQAGATAAGKAAATAHEVDEDDDAPTVWPGPSVVPSFLSVAPGPPAVPFVAHPPRAPSASDPPAQPHPLAQPHPQGEPAPTAAPVPTPGQVDLLHRDPTGAGTAPAVAGGMPDDGAFTVHRPIEALPGEVEPAVPPGRGRGRKVALAVVACAILAGMTAGALVLTGSHPPVKVKKTSTITTTDTDRPSDVTLTRTSTGASLNWTAAPGVQLPYLVIEVAPDANKVLGKTAPGTTTLAVAGVDPTTTADCFEVTAVLGATKVGAPASWCPTGESVSGT